MAKKKTPAVPPEVASAMAAAGLSVIGDPPEVVTRRDPPSVVYTFETLLEFHIPHTHKIHVNRALNKFHYGKELLPATGDLPQSLKDAAWLAGATHQTRVVFTVFSDGDFRVDPVYPGEPPK